MSRFDEELVRRSDGRALGTLSIIRTWDTKLHDENGRRLVNPVKVDALIISLVNPNGEQVFWRSYPFDRFTHDATDDMPESGE